MRALCASLLALGALGACGSSLPSPPELRPPATDFADVPYPPPPARPESVPPRPDHAVWVDGSWAWTGTAYRWRDGGWYAPPPAGVVFTNWAIDRPGATRLTFAPAAWRDRAGKTVDGPPMLASAAIGPGAREREAADAGATSEGGAP